MRHTEAQSVTTGQMSIGREGQWLNRFVLLTWWGLSGRFVSYLDTKKGSWPFGRLRPVELKKHRNNDVFSPNGEMIRGMTCDMYIFDGPKVNWLKWKIDPNFLLR